LSIVERAVEIINASDCGRLIVDHRCAGK